MGAGSPQVQVPGLPLLPARWPSWIHFLISLILTLCTSKILHSVLQAYIGCLLRTSTLLSTEDLWMSMMSSSLESSEPLRPRVVRLMWEHTWHHMAGFPAYRELICFVFFSWLCSQLSLKMGKSKLSQEFSNCSQSFLLHPTQNLLWENVRIWILTS